MRVYLAQVCDPRILNNAPISCIKSDNENARGGGQNMQMYLSGISQAQTRKFITNAEREYEAIPCRKPYNQKRGGLANTDIDFRGLYVLESFFYAAQNPFFELLYNKGIDLLLDSGAFTFMQQGGKCDWDKYIEEYAAFINKYRVEKFFELDIDSIVGLKETERLRDRLENLTNRKCIPVWHKSRGLDYFKQMCSAYPYVAFGGLLTDGVKSNDIEKAIPWFVNTAHNAGTKIHVLGYTPLNLANKGFQMDSVDSTTWIAGNRYGHIYYFDEGCGVMRKVDKKEGQRVRNMQAARHNFIEWIKFQKYLDKRR